MDRTFLLADARPARETIYPAATRHRERLDIYVNRAPLALDIADRRADNDREAAVTDTEIRTYLAERWSRSQPKEAALDYMADGVWQDRRESVREDRSRSPGETPNETGKVRAAANDNALARIARDVRRTAFGWRHAQTVSFFRRWPKSRFSTAYDDLRERTRALKATAVALGACLPARRSPGMPCCRNRQRDLPRPGRTNSPPCLPSAAASPARTSTPLRTSMPGHGATGARPRCGTCTGSRRKRNRKLNNRNPNCGKGSWRWRAAATRRPSACRYGGRGTRPGCSRPIVTRRRGPARRYRPAGRSRRLPLGTRRGPRRRMCCRRTGIPPRPDWYAPYEAFQRDWNELINRVQETGVPLFYAKGYAAMIPRIRALAENPDIPAGTRAPILEALENHQRDLSARKYVEYCLDAAERHMGTHASLQRVAGSLGVPIVKVSYHLGWRQEADRLTAAAETILADGERYGAHLDNMESGRARVEGELSRLRHVIREDGEYASQRKTPELHSEPVDTQEKVEQPKPAEPAWMPAYEALRQDWNSLIEDARQAGIPLFYANGYMDIIPRIRD